MKKILFLISLSILCSNQLFAQSNKDSFLYTGIKLGYNYSTFIGNDKPGKDVSTIPGFAIGAFLCYKFNKTLSAQSEIYITTKGSRVNTIGDINKNNIFVYFQLPFLAKMTFFPENRSHLKPFILFGPALSIKVMAMNFTGMLDNINPVDWGLIFRVGIEYWKISFEISYDNSITNFDKSTTHLDIRNQSISLITGFAF